MAYIVGIDRNQTRMITTSLDALIDEDNSVRVIDAYVDSLDLIELGFKEYNGTNRGQAPHRRADLLKLHIYGYLNKIRSSRSLEIECKRNLEEYEKTFNSPLIIHNSTLTIEEINKIIRKCLSTGKDWWEITGDTYDPDAHY